MATPQTTDPTIAARRAAVAELHAHGVSNRDIATRQGVSEATVRRDLAVLAAERRATEAQAAAEQVTRDTERDATRQDATPTTAPHPAAPRQPRDTGPSAPRQTAPQRPGLWLDVDDSLAADLRTLVESLPGAQFTNAGARAAIRAAIRHTADMMREAQARGIRAERATEEQQTAA